MPNRVTGLIVPGDGPGPLGVLASALLGWAGFCPVRRSWRGQGSPAATA
jgi:hypothetical protein